MHMNDKATCKAVAVLNVIHLPTRYLMFISVAHIHCSTYNNSHMQLHYIVQGILAPFYKHLFCWQQYALSFIYNQEYFSVALVKFLSPHKLLFITRSKVILYMAMLAAVFLSIVSFSGQIFLRYPN